MNMRDHPVFVGNNVYDVMCNIKDHLESRIKGIKEIIMKINMVSAREELSMTPKIAIEETLEFIFNELNYGGKVIILEGSAVGGDTFSGYRNLNVTELVDKYDLELFDIHDDEYYYIRVFDSKFNEFELPISKRMVKKKFLISICRAKTHDTVIVTLSLKNVAVGGIVGRNNRPKIHQGYKAINFNIAILSAVMFPDLAIVDGRIGMQGNGPVAGYPKRWGYVFIGFNPVNVDSIVARGMGFDPKRIGYIYYLSRLGFGRVENIEVRGVALSSISSNFEPHYLFKEQLKWKLPSNEEELMLDKCNRIIIDFYTKHSIPDPRG